MKHISALLSRNTRMGATLRNTQISRIYNRFTTKMSSNSGHDYGSGSEAPSELEKLMLRVKTHQETVPRPTFAEEVRTLIDNSIK